MKTMSPPIMIWFVTIHNDMVYKLVSFQGGLPLGTHNDCIYRIALVICHTKPIVYHFLQTYARILDNNARGKFCCVHSRYSRQFRSPEKSRKQRLYSLFGISNLFHFQFWFWISIKPSFQPLDTLNL